MIELSAEKIVHVILKARQFDASVASWEEAPDANAPDGDAESILEDFGHDETRSELADFIGSLNIDEQENLVALTWVGRGTYSPADFDKALKTARREHINKTQEYLLGIPLLSDYLEEGLSLMGYSVEELEADMMGRAPDLH